MKISAICSAGGAAFFSVADILIESGQYKADDFFVVTDRECAAEAEAEKRGVKFCRIEDHDNESFSGKTQKELDTFKPDLLLLYYTRLVTETVSLSQPTFNIHPSLLPSFKGFGAIRQAIENNARFLGATLHLVSNIADSGYTIAQAVTPIMNHSDTNVLNKSSYIQKVYLSLCAVDFVENGLIEVHQNFDKVIYTKPLRKTYTSNPALNSKHYINAFKDFQNQFGMEVMIP